ncbi:MAG TPA: hypothetical protein ENJ95_13380 [Bacteroidetes bacterium]|nr:hypothetical protein [Bacteroidota bacterium]
MAKKTIGNKDLPAGQPNGQPEKKKKRNRLFRWGRNLLLFLVLLIVLPILIFQIPIVQDYSAKELTKFLSKELNTVVSVEKAELGIFYNIELKNFYVEDLKGDTILYAGLFEVDHTGLYRLLCKQLEIESLRLDDAYFVEGRQAGQEAKNYQFIIDYFTKGKKKKKEDDGQGSPFVLSLDHILFNNLRFHKPDGAKGETIDVTVPKFEAFIDKFDLPGKRIEMSRVGIFGPDVRLDQYVGQPFPEKEPLQQTVAEASENVPPDTSRLHVFIKKFDLTGGMFKNSNRRKEPVKKTGAERLNFNYLDVYDIGLHFRDFDFTNKLEFTGKIDSSSLRERSGFIIENLASQNAELTCEGLSLLGMELRTPQTALGDTLVFKYNGYHDWESFPQEVKMDLRFSEDAYVALKDIMAFAHKLNNNPFFKENKEERVNLTGQFKGTVDRLNGKNLKMNLANGLFIEGGFSTFNLTVKDEQFIHLELDRLRTTMLTLRKLIPGFKPPENFDRLGKLDFSGNFDGFFVDFVADGQLQTDIGSASMDANMKLRGGLEKALYSGQLNLKDFDLATWTGNKDFGKISFKAQVKEGKGLTLNAADAKLDGRIDSLVFKGYHYTDVSLNGELKKNRFKGDLLSRDKNINFDFGGEVDFTDSIPEFDFKTDIQHLALKALHLSDKDLQFSGKAELELKGKRLSDVVGDAQVTGFQVIKNQTDTLNIDSALVRSTLADSGEKQFTLHSNLGNLDINGQFDIEKIPNKFVEFIHENYPRFADKLKLNMKPAGADTMQFEYVVELFELQNLVNFFDEKINGFDETKISGAYDGYADNLSLEVEIPKWSYQNTVFKDVYVRANLDKDDGTVQLGVIETQLGKKRKLSPVSLIGTVYEDTLEFLVISSNFFKILDNININGVLSIEDNQDWRISFKQSDLVILNETWNIDTTNFIRIGEGKVETENFQLFNGEQHIALRSYQEKGLELQVRKVPLESIDFLRNIKKLRFEGMANLDVKASDVFKLKGLSTNLDIHGLTVNGDDYGRLNLNGRAESLKDRVTTNLNITGDTTKLRMAGYVNLPSYQPKKEVFGAGAKKNYFDVAVELEKIPVSIISYFVPAILNPEGSLSSSNIRLHGPFNKPNLSGVIAANDISFKIKALQTTFRVPQGEVFLTNSMIDATGGVAYDELGNKAFLTGGLTHDHLRDFGVDLIVATEKDRPFLSLNTTEKDNSVFYGRAVGTGFARFSGSFKQTDLYVSGKSMPGTHMYLPLTGTSVVEENRFIRFTEDERRAEKEAEKDKGEAADLRGLGMEFHLDITPDAEMEVIFDKAWGDVLRGAGEGDVTVFLERDGEFKMYGEVTVARGDYLFTLMNILNKPFEIEPGGTIVWTSDPYNAEINLNAVYKGVNASVYGFVQEYLTVASEDAKQTAKRSIPVLLKMNLTGKLLSPDIAFDIEFQSLDSELRSFVENKLRSIRQDPNELNRQVFGLLVLGQFLPSGFNVQAGDIGLNTVSEMISNQLSIILTQFIVNIFDGSKIIKGLDFDVSYNRYSGGTLEDPSLYSGDEVQYKIRVAVTDRINVRIGQQFGVGSNTVYVGNANAYDFEFEYDITKDGRFKIKVYNSGEPDLLGGKRIESGFGLSFKKEFNSYKELFEFKNKMERKRKRAEKRERRERLKN